MDNLLKKVVFVHQLLWILIGVVFLVLLLRILLIDPERILQATLGPATVSATTSQIPSVAPQGQTPAARNVSPQMAQCLETALGTDRAQQILQGTSQPTDQDRQKAQSCLSSSPPQSK
jgi:hypothetical protein